MFGFVFVWLCFLLGKDLADIFADDPDHDELDVADCHQADDERGIARDRLAIYQRFPEDRDAEQEGRRRQQYAEQAREAKRGDRERGEALARKPDQATGTDRRHAVLARGWLIVDAVLAE